MDRTICSCASGAMPFCGHAGAQPDFDFFHALLRALEAHGAAQFFGFASGEVGHDHRNAQQLFLKKRYAERALQHRLERGMRIGDGFAALPALQKGIHHLADDRAGADDRDLHHDVVEALGRRRGRQDICARLSIWNMPTVSAFCRAE